MPVGVPAEPVQARIWMRLRAAPEPGLTTTELRRGIDTSFQTVAYRLGLWVQAGLVLSTARRPRRYRLADTVEPMPLPPVIDRAGRALPRPRTTADMMWDAIRVLKRFDLPTVRSIAGTTGTNTRGYIGLLQRTGYVRMLHFGNPRTGECATYALVRPTGPKAPRETIRIIDGRRVRQLHDPNTGETHDVSRGSPSQRRPYRPSAKRADRGEG